MTIHDIKVIHPSIHPSFYPSSIHPSFFATRPKMASSVCADAICIVLKRFDVVSVSSPRRQRSTEDTCVTVSIGVLALASVWARDGPRAVSAHARCAGTAARLSRARAARGRLGSGRLHCRGAAAAAARRQDSDSRSRCPTHPRSTPVPAGPPRQAPQQHRPPPSSHTPAAPAPHPPAATTSPTPAAFIAGRARPCEAVRLQIRGSEALHPSILPPPPLSTWRRPTQRGRPSSSAATSTSARCVSAAHRTPSCSTPP
jgi:hypothetical protein